MQSIIKYDKRKFGNKPKVMSESERTEQRKNRKGVRKEKCK